LLLSFFPVPERNPQSLKPDADEPLLGMGQICCKQEKSQKAVAQSLQASLVREQKRDYHQVYDVVGLIGEGSISNIYKIKKKQPAFRGSARKHGRSNAVDKTRHKRHKTLSGEVYALKEIDLAFVKEGHEDELRNEIDLLKQLDHPNIIKAYETFLFKKKLSIVLELCTGGDLHKRHP
jgi:serine/threonine protein kinase